MKVFDDYITLWNGGTLPPGYTVEKLMEPHESHPRNRLMANVFYMAGFIEAWGRGYEKIRDAFKAEQLEQPVFEEVRGGFMVTIKRERFIGILGRRNVPSSVTSNVTSDVTSCISSLSVAQLTDRQKHICKMIRNNPHISVKEMSLVLSLVERTVKRDLAALQKMGLLIREGNTSAGRWVLLKETNRL